MKRLYTILLIFAFLLTFSTLSFAKDYSFPKVEQKITIYSNGNIDVTEYRTFSFSGNFHWAKYYIPKKGFSELTNIWIGERLPDGKIVKYKKGKESKGGFIVYKGDNEYTIKWFYNKKDEDATFVIHYMATDVVKVYNDVAEFYWKLVGNEWSKPVRSFSSVITLPPGIKSKDEVKIFAHGPLWGRVDFLDKEHVIYTVSKLPSYKFFEARILMPPRIFPNVKRRINKNMYNAIMDQELKWAKEADKERERAKKILEARRKKAHIAAFILIVFGLLVPIILIFLFIKDYFRYGKEYKPQFQGDYYRETPSDDPPAIVSYLMGFGNIDKGKAFTATLMDLVRRGYIKLTEIKRDVNFLVFHKTATDYKLEITDKPRDELTVFEDNLLSFLQRVGNYEEEVMLSDIKKYAKKYNQKVYKWFEKWEKTIKKEAEQRQFIEPESVKAVKKWIFISLAYEGIFTLIGFVSGGFQSLEYADATDSTLILGSLIIGYILIAIPLIFSPTLKRRSREAVELFAKWNAFKRFLTHFSNMKEAIPRSVIIWEKYLVYAIILDVAKEVIKQLKVYIEQGQLEDMDRAYLFSSFARGDIGSFAHSLDAFASSVDAISSVASSASSSTGSGGGASGGGGGGGGGGHGGAG